MSSNMGSEYFGASFSIRLFFVPFLIGTANAGYDPHLRGPSFLVEPLGRLEFSNSSGGWIDCSASGIPPSTVEWQAIDGSLLSDLNGIRKIHRNGTLVLLPFSPSAFRQDVHSTTVRCVASNSVGRIVSRDVQIRAVVSQTYTVDIESLGAARGCTAILKCRVPDFVKDFIKVVSWVQEPAMYIYPSMQRDGKYHLLPTGELLVHNLEFSDQFSTYHCRTKNRLSRQVTVSNPSNVRISEHRGLLSPIIVEHTPVVTVSQDEGAILLCLAQACPEPDYKWFYVAAGEPRLLLAGPRVRLMGPILAIEAATPDDAGHYRCTVSNPAGDSSVDIKLIVVTQIHVEIFPSLLSIHMGASGEFRCIVSPHSSMEAYSITWYKDGRQIPNNARGRDTMAILSAGREDRGMYQCMVRKSSGYTIQASAELQLGDSPPSLIYSFIEQTIQVGPSVSLKCSASGNPTPQISWTLDGFALPSNGRFVIGQYVTVHGDVISHVNISSVMVEDGGEYACQAENRAGKSNHAARLNIYGLPIIRPIPKITAIAGETLTLKCPVGGYPIEKIHWEKDGRDLPNDLRQKVLADGTLIISHVQKSLDAGSYICEARNKQGHTARRTGEVSVIVPPQLSPFHSSSVSLNVGDRASLTCSAVKGDPPLQVSWAKDGRPLDPSHRASVTKVDQFNSVLIIESLTPEHDGNYSCAVRNQAAEVSHSQRLTVNVPPIIEPFSFQDGLAEGMRTRTICGVSSGDLPLSLRWVKDGRPLDSGLEADVSAVDSYSSLLSIPSLTAGHSGTYSCLASNQAAEVSYSAELVVKVPPRWAVEPADVSVQRGRTAALTCIAHAVPPAAISWKKAIGGRIGGYDELRDIPQTKVLPNGTLLLQHAMEDVEGFYLCQAQNGIGSGIGRMIQLKVNSPPYFALSSRLVTVKKSNTATLKCDVNGDKPITVVWLRENKRELNPSTNYRITVKQEITADGILAEIQITNVIANDSGPYFCQASNPFGADQQLIQLLVQEPPKSPHNLQVVMVSSQSVKVKWQHDSIGETSEVNKFSVEYRDGARPWLHVDIVEIPLPYTAVIEDLKPATKYDLRVIAEGPAGKSPPSQELQIRTEPQRPGGPPTNIAAKAISSTKILITWSPPIFEMRHGEIQGYNIGYRKIIPKSTMYNYTKVTGDAEDGGELLLSLLDKFTTYTITIQAYNQMGPGPPSDHVTVQTLEDVPGRAPEDLRCAALSSQSIQVSWQPPPSQFCNGNLLGYKLFFEPVNFDYVKNIGHLEMRKTTALTAVLTGLGKYTNYSMQALAHTFAGDGVMSSPITCLTEEDVPEAPVDIKVLMNTPQSMLVSWLPPAEPNGIVTKYNLYTRIVDGRQEVNHSKHSIPSQQTMFEAKNLQLNVEYQYWVTASTRIGEGKSSKVASMISTGRVPAMILSFGVDVIRPWRGSASLSCQAVGQPRREWFRGDNSIHSNNHNIQIRETGELILSGLQHSDSNNYTCKAENGVGIDRITYKLIVQVPPAAPTVYIRSATSSSILIDWKAGHNGDSPILGFTLYFRKTHDNIEDVSLSRHINTFELKNLYCGSMYHLYMTSRNKIGTSPASISLNVRTQGQAPGIPLKENVIISNSTSAVVKLQAWPDNGCPILSFTIYLKKLHEFGYNLISDAIKPQKRYLITGLLPSSTYYIKIKAANVAGSNTHQFGFSTLTIDGETLPPEIYDNDFMIPQLNNDYKFLIMCAIVVFAVMFCLYITSNCYQNSKRLRRQQDTVDNEQNAETLAQREQRERYYATIHKVAMQDKIPETSADISPYATFQLSEATAIGNTVRRGGAETMLHAFAYHERATTEGCAAQPKGSKQSHPAPLALRVSPYYNMNSKSNSRRRQNHRKNDPDSEDSESDIDQLNSSRTQSSNNPENVKLKHNFIYHGTQSSTSSDLSPMSEQKTLPRKSRGRNTGLRGGSATIAETHFGCERPLITEGIPPRHELPEEESDVETLKKLKLGLRSTLWSRPQGNNSSSQHPSDYSIAV